MDELTALRRFESDTPAPSEATLTHAFAALTERMDAAESDHRSRSGASAAARAPRARRRNLIPIWTTAVVSAAVAVVALIAVQAAPAPSRFQVGAPAATTAAASVSPPPAPSATPTSAATGRPDYEFDLSDAHDVARANAELACYRSHGVKVVGLTKPDEDGIAFIEYGGAHDDQQSIALGLQYQKVCDAAGAAVE